MPDDVRYWDRRARSFDRLEWARNHAYLRTFIRLGAFRRHHLVLDVGTGTAIVAKAVAPRVSQVIAIDISQRMLDRTSWDGNMRCIRADIRRRLFAEGVFDRVTARMVFHHILRDTQKAMDECYRVLRRGGRMILSEGVPPCEEVRDDFVRIFRLKERRLTFMGPDLVEMMRRAGFCRIRTHEVRLRRMSVRNWLRNSGLASAVQERIYRMHVDSSEVFQRAYRLVRRGDDCLIDFRQLIIVGIK